jgi:hypothetical protein
VTTPGLSAPQQALLWQLDIALTGVMEGDTPVAEYRFHPTRLWRFDVAFVKSKLAIEIDGGGFIFGRHSRGLGIEADCEKYAEALLLGWRVLRITPKHVKSGQALHWIEALITERAHAAGVAAPEER